MGSSDGFFGKFAGSLSYAGECDQVIPWVFEDFFSVLLDLGKRFLWQKQTKQSGSLVYACWVAWQLLAWNTVRRLDSCTREVKDEQKAQLEIRNG